MPVTAKLSRAFYERFGDEIANELVNWFNAVDDTYRADLRELNEVNFARFDAKIGERLAELDAKWVERWTVLDAKIEQRVGALGKEVAEGLRRSESRLLGWMVGVTLAVWIPTGVGILTLLFR